MAVLFKVGTMRCFEAGRVLAILSAVGLLIAACGQTATNTLDAGVPPADGGADAGVDAGSVAGLGDGGDAGSDAGSDGGLDAGPSLGSVAVGQTLGPTIPSDFAGLSIEFVFITYGNTFFGTPLKDGGLGPARPQVVQLLRTLGPGSGTLRVGGSSGDQLCLAGTVNFRCAGYFTETELAEIFGTAQLADWRVILGVNLGIDDPAYAVYEIQNGVLPAVAALDAGALLSALEIGNEPDLFSGHLYNVPLPDGGVALVRERDAGYGMTGIIDDTVAYVRAFAAVPAVKALPLAGPAVNDAPSLLRLPSYASSLSAIEPGEPRFLTAHIYPTNTCPGTPSDGGDWGSIPNLLSVEAFDRWTRFVGEGVAAAADAGLQLRIGESNSSACGGAPGVSNTVASALWGLDFLLSVAELGARGVNFHGPGSAADYAPIATSGTDAGGPQAQPLYYAMLAFDQTAAGRQWLPATVDAGAYVTAYALWDADAGATTVVAINKSLDAGGSLTIAVPHGGSTAALTVLTGPSLGAEGGVTWGGGGVDVNGVFSGATSTPVQPDPATGVYVVALPNGAAVALRVPAP